MRFEVIHDEIVLDSICHTVFGIVCIDAENVCHSFTDLSYNLNAVKSFADDLNALQPDFSQLEYIIEDFYIGQN